MAWVKKQMHARLVRAGAPLDTLPTMC